MSTETVTTLSPNVCFDTDVDDKNGYLEIALPGVKKEDIVLKIDEEGYSLTATRGDAKYVASQGFCCPVVPEKATAKYDNGLLKITVPFKEAMDNSVSVKIQ